MSELIKDHEINIGRLESIFKASHFHAERDKDGDLMVMGATYKFCVTIDSNRKFIKFMWFCGFKENVSELIKLNFINQLNNNCVLVRFSVLTPDILTANYHFFYEGGVSSYFIINNFKMFQDVINCFPMVYGGLGVLE